MTRDGANLPLVANTRIRLSFDGNQIGASAGCNSMSGTFAMDGDTLLFQGGGMTEMGCDPPRHAQDDWLFGFLGAHPTVALSGNDLTLTAGGTVITLVDREVAEPDVQLVGPQWTLDSIITGDAVSSMPMGVVATIQFADDGSVTLDTGCNSGGGRVTVDGQTLHFDDLVTTKGGCAGAAGQVESLFLGVLANDVTFTIDFESLTLMAGGQGLQFRAG